MTDEIDAPLAVHDFMRSYPIGDLTIAEDGDGRTVTAFAAVFNRSAEVRDQDGHYNEVLAPDSFKQTIATRGTNFGVFYNHGKTLYGTPSEAGSVPIGVPLEAPRAATVGGVDGLLTVTRYLDNPLANSILDGIKQRAITGQSFTGRFMKSSRSRAEKGALPTITRHEVAMREYGPTPFPVYADAAILGTRSVVQFLEEIAKADPEDIDRLRNMLGLATPLEPVEAAGTPSGAALVEEPAASHSTRRQHQHLRARAREIGVL